MERQIGEIKSEVNQYDKMIKQKKEELDQINESMKSQSLDSKDKETITHLEE